MKLWLALTIIGAVLIVAWAAYMGWGLVLLSAMGRMAGWDFISPIILYGLALLIPGVITLFFGIKRLRLKR